MSYSYPAYKDEQAKNWGCPDWRNQKAYPENCEALEDWQWQWEFMRRIPDYRSIWLHVDYDRQHGGNKPYWSPDNAWYFNLTTPIDPRTQPEEMPFTQWPGMSFKLPTKEHLDVYVKRALNELSHLSRKDALEGFHEFIWSNLTPLGVTEDSKYDHIALIKFDLRLPLESQLRLAKKQLKTDREGFEIKQVPRAHLTGKARENWPRHLRIIDAKDQGATHSEIAEQFLEDDLVDEATLYKATGNRETELSRHKAIVSQWHSQALEVMEKASRLL